MFHFSINLIAALVLGAVIGLERQWRQRMAGLRTNALVAAGASLFAAVSQQDAPGVDQSRIAAQVVSGIGFLGAGVIMREGLSVSGLNTAATLWCSAAVGLIAGFGSPLRAAVGAISVLCANLFLRTVAKKINVKSQEAQVEQSFPYRVRIVCREPDESHIRALIVQAVGISPLVLRSIHSEDLNGSQKIEVTADIESNAKNHLLIEQIVSRISLERGVSAATWKVGAEEVAA
jgi:putative Mg2+ transporter-C (MgtC) family protein